jgi:hypothetical protein
VRTALASVVLHREIASMNAPQLPRPNPSRVTWTPSLALARRNVAVEIMSTSTGNAGEHLVMAELLARGFDAYWADRANLAYDPSPGHSLTRPRR